MFEEDINYLKFNDFDKNMLTDNNSIWLNWYFLNINLVLSSLDYSVQFTQMFFLRLTRALWEK